MALQEWFSGFREVSERIGGLLPALFAALLLLVAGWIIAKLLAWATRRGVGALVAQVGRRASWRSAMESSGAATQVPAVIATFVFWVVFIFFVAAAMETLGLPVVTASLSRVAYYLPNVLAALVMVFAGMIAGRILGAAVARAASRAGMAFAPTLGGTVRWTIVLVSVVVAIEQVGIQADILIVLVAVVIGSALAGAGLAFGLGARTAVSNIIASHYVAQAYRVGQTVRVAGIEGKIIQTTPTAVFVAGPNGRVMIPAKAFSEEVSVLLTETDSAG